VARLLLFLLSSRPPTVENVSAQARDYTGLYGLEREQAAPSREAVEAEIESFEARRDLRITREGGEEGGREGEKGKRTGKKVEGGGPLLSPPYFPVSLFFGLLVFCGRGAWWCFSTALAHWTKGIIVAVRHPHHPVSSARLRRACIWSATSRITRAHSVGHSNLRRRGMGRSVRRDRGMSAGRPCCR